MSTAIFTFEQIHGNECGWCMAEVYIMPLASLLCSLLLKNKPTVATWKYFDKLKFKAKKYWLKILPL